MPRKFPSQKIDILGKPDSTPENDVRKFIESYNVNKLYHFIKKPVWDSVGFSLEDFYLGARMEHEGMMRQKSSLIEHQRLQNIVNKSRQERLYRTQAKLRNCFIKVNVFLRDFAEKGKSAVKRGLNELATHKEIRASNDKIRNGLNELYIFRKIIKATSDEYEPYETVLNDVVAQFPDFKSVKELMDRCDALMLAQVEISELSQAKILDLEIKRKGLVAIANKAALQILGLKNALSSVDRLYEAARNETLKWEKTFSRVKDAINKGLFTKDRTLESINDMYRLLCRRSSIYPELPYEAISQRLDFIKDEVELLQEILNQQQKAASKVTEMAIVC